jgi:serine protease inhibitor
MMRVNSRALYGLAVIVLATVVIGSQAPTVSDWLTGSKARQEIPVLDDSGATASSVEATVDAYNGFAYDLYRRYSAGEGNILFSPYSVSTALSMTYEGARGETAEEMEAVFGFPEDPSERLPATARIYNTLNGEGRDYALHTVNALWLQQDYAVLEDYVDAISGYYGGDANVLDFVAEAEESRLIINEWVEERTNQRIKDLFPPGSIDADVRLVLTNAIYFKGDWLYEFDEEATSAEDFHVTQSTAVEADLMSLHGSFDYAETDEFQLLELPYTGGDVSMLVLLPKEGRMGEVEAQLSTEMLDEWVGMIKETDLDVYLPRFTFDTKYFMMEDLAEMGMPTAFTGDADFSGMTGTRELYIDMVIHQAFIEVNEKGTEAAAATGVSMRLSAAMPGEVFRADRPFTFLIRDVDTGMILFMGRVADPS